MSDRYAETSSVSWLGRIGRSIGGVVFGLLLLVVMLVLLFWNEARAVTTARSLAEGAGIFYAASCPGKMREADAAVEAAVEGS